MYQDLTGASPLVVTYSLIVKQDHSWVLHVHGHLVDPVNVPSLQSFPSSLSSDLTSLLLHQLGDLHTCIGNPEEKYIALAESKKNRQFLSEEKGVVAYVDRSVCIVVGNQTYASTVRCSKCYILTSSMRCSVCATYLQGVTKLTIGKKKYKYYDLYNVLYMQVHENSWEAFISSECKKTLCKRDQKIAQMQKQFESLTSQRGVRVTSDVQEKIGQMIKACSKEIESLPASNFRKIFWEQQVRFV